MSLLEIGYKVRKIHLLAILGNILTHTESKVINGISYQFNDLPDWSRFCNCNSQPTVALPCIQPQAKCLWETEKKKGLLAPLPSSRLDVVWVVIETWKSWSFQDKFNVFFQNFILSLIMDNAVPKSDSFYWCHRKVKTVVQINTCPGETPRGCHEMHCPVTVYRKQLKTMSLMFITFKK